MAGNICEIDYKIMDVSKTINGHDNKCVNILRKFGDYYFVSAGNDGYIKFWNMKKLELEH